MTLEDVEAWALSHGFRARGDRVVSAPVGDLRIDIEFMRQNVRVTASRGEATMRIATCSRRG